MRLNTPKERPEMALETATYINQLVPANPTPTDPVGQGDDHVRLIKSTIQASFPNFTAAALASSNAQIDGAVTQTGTNTTNITTNTTNITTNAANITALQAFMANLNTIGVSELAPYICPHGTILPYAGTSLPNYWMWCDGASYSTAAYAALFAAIGYTYGGSGANFNVPDLRGRVPAGTDAVSNRLAGTSLGGAGPGASDGVSTISIAVGNLPAHNHGITDPGHAHTITLTDPGHTHTDAGHTHTDAGHTHGASDSGHTHTVPGYAMGSVYGTNITASNQSTLWVNEGTSTGYANITVATGNASINTGTASINSHTTGITASASSNTTGISTQNTGSGTAITNVQPTLLINYIIASW